MSNKKSSKKSIKLSTAYKKLAEALETEAITGKNYRAIQKYLMVLKKSCKKLLIFFDWFG